MGSDALRTPKQKKVVLGTDQSEVNRLFFLTELNVQSICLPKHTDTMSVCTFTLDYLTSVILSLETSVTDLKIRMVEINEPTQ